MGWLDGLKRALSRSADADDALQAAAARPPAEPEQEIRVPEMSAAELLAELSAGGGDTPLLLDCREHYERAQGYIPGSVHIPMNSIPMRLNELDPGQPIVVYCAHGNRSYGVAGWLNQQGYQAVSLKGGIVDWQLRQGPIEAPFRTRT